MRHLKKSFAVLALAPLVLSACAPAESASAPAGSTSITFAVPDQSLSASTASYATVPKVMGYFADEHLDVQMQPVESALAAVQAVAAGNAYCTYASTANAASTVVTDPKLVIVGTTNGNIFRTVAPKSSGMRTMADLEGKTVGVTVLTAIMANLAKGGMESQGLTVAENQLLAVGLGARAAQAFKSGDIQAYSGYDSPNLVIESLIGEELVDLDSETNDLTGTSSLVCRADDVKNNPEVIAGLWRAFFKASVFSAENPEAAIKMHWSEFPASKPTEGDEASRLKLAVHQLSKRLEITGGPGTAGKYGQQNDADLKKTLDTYLKYGILKGAAADYEVGKLTDYSLVEKYNDFDAEAIKAEAKAYTAAK